MALIIKIGVLRIAEVTGWGVVGAINGSLGWIPASLAGKFLHRIRGKSCQKLDRNI